MTRRSDGKTFVLAFLAAILALLGLIEFRVVERVSYEMEKGRLKALKETPPTSDELALVMWTRRAADLARPAVVSIETDFGLQVTTGSPESRGGSRDPSQTEAGLSAPSSDDETSAEDQGGQPDTLFVHQGLGSGFIFDAEKGHVLTNAHVVDRARRIVVTLDDGRETEAEVLGSDSETDLAVLRIDLPRLHELSFGESDAIRVGDDVLAVGNPFGLDGTVSKGIISATGRRHLAVGDRVYMGLLQTDAVITTGNSGGPLIDMHGDVIGINTAMATTGGEYDGVGFAIPSRRASELVDDLVDGGPGFLGIYAGTVASSHWRREARELGWTERTGALVTDILRNTAAEQAGIVPGDIILAVGDVRIESIEQLSALLAATKPGTDLTIELWRDGERKTLPVKLGRKYAPR